ncbi:SDR family NAD(P)-dependent oxidoreductase [Gorillibacterium massiliense]|uniref:SDR family NAD(P)-dependent oxidoreductase n=1 Tax=Gorillibacterium massiliense TaxID=1280390 RepID=UPI0004AF4C28|nr:SDR family oxidoreductase [Gorillibacterium massiliense]
MTAKTALIAGPLSGIVTAIAQTLASEGYRTALVYPSHTDAAEAEMARLANDADGKPASQLAAYPVDFEQPEEAERILAQAADELGVPELLVYCAIEGAPDLLTQTETEQMDRLYRINYRGAVLFAKAAANRMIDAGVSGSILFVTTVHGLQAYKNNVLPGSFSAALHRTAESLALQLAPHGIRVNCIASGITAGGAAGQDVGSRIPLGVGSPEAVAESVAYLASSRAGHITGVTLKVDGGMTLPGMPEYGRGPGWDTPQAAPDLFR